MEIQSEERREWLRNPVTQEFLQLLRESRQATLEDWARKQFVGEGADETMVRNASALGGVQVLDQVIDRFESYGE